MSGEGLEAFSASMGKAEKSVERRMVRSVPMNGLMEAGASFRHT